MFDGAFERPTKTFKMMRVIHDDDVIVGRTFLLVFVCFYYSNVGDVLHL